MNAGRDTLAHRRDVVTSPTGRWRSFLATALITVSAVLAPLAVVAVWAHDDIGDTDRYVELVTPLASDPAVQDAVIARVTRELLDRLTESPLTDALRGVVEEQVGRLVRSPRFVDVWIRANRAAHTQVVAVLTGNTGSSVDVEGGTVRLNLAGVIEAVKERLVASGLPLAERIPVVDAQFTILQSDDLARARTGFRVLSDLALVLPWLVLLLLCLAVAAARSRWRLLAAGSLAIVAAMVLLGVAVKAFRVVYLDAVPPERLAPDAAAAVYDALTEPLWQHQLVVAVIFLVVALIAWWMSRSVRGRSPAGVAPGS